MKSKEEQSKQLIKSYVVEIFKSSEKRRIIEYIVDDTSGYAGSSASGSELFNTFIKPFTDVIGTVVGKTKEVMRSGITLLQVSFETLMTTLVPFLTDSYDEIFAKEKADIQKIRGEYQGYYDSTARALGSTDASVLALMAFPGATLASKIFKPSVAKNILSVATGGMSDDILNRNVAGSRKSPSNMFDSYERSHNRLLSEDEKDTNTLSSVIVNKKIIDSIINRSPTIKSAEKAALQLHKANLAKRIEPILQILDANSIKELSAVLRKPIEEPDLSALDPQKKLSAIEMEKRSFESVKNTAVKAATQQIENYIKPVRVALGDNHPFVQDYIEVLQTIKSADPNKLEILKKKLML